MMERFSSLDDVIVFARSVLLYAPIDYAQRTYKSGEHIASWSGYIEVYYGFRPMAWRVSLRRKYQEDAPGFQVNVYLEAADVLLDASQFVVSMAAGISPHFQHATGGAECDDCGYRVELEYPLDSEGRCPSCRNEGDEA